MMVEAILALGSNVGDREEKLRQAFAMIDEQLTVNAVSSVYETEPMYLENQNWFLNCVVAVETDLKPSDLLRKVMAIELALGREKGERYGPRTIDIDILFYGNRVVSEPGLEIPHPLLAERPFVLIPLNEIRPELIHPVAGLKVSELCKALKRGKKVLKRDYLIG